MRFPALAALLAALCCWAPAHAAPLKVVTGTALIDDIVVDLTGGEVQTLTLIKGSSCPGHESVRTTDFLFAADADLVLIHGSQRTMLQLANLPAAVNNTDARLVALEEQGPWTLPAVQKAGVRAIAAVLAKADPDNAPAIGARAAARLGRIDAAAAEHAALLKTVDGKKVIVAERQAEFARWAGLEVEATYGRAEDMTPARLAALVTAARGKDIAAVIDNYQSGSEAGLPLARELRVPHLVLSSFPGFSDQAPDWFGLLRCNSARLLTLSGQR